MPKLYFFYNKIFKFVIHKRKMIKIEAIKDIKEIDKELERLIEERRPKIKIVGVGGAGNNTIDRMYEVGIKGAELIAVNTDAQDLLYTKADYKVLIGRELTKGLGAGGNPLIGEEAVKEAEAEIRKSLEGASVVFITCGLGGGTGTGASPKIVQIARSLGALTVAVVTLPFTIEGPRRFENAINGLEKLEEVVNTIIIIPNDKLLEIVPDLPIQTAFKIADEVLINSIKGITELITTPGLVNLDFADVKAILENGGISLIGLGESDTQNRAIEAVEKAINNPLLDVEVKNIKGALINIVGGNDLKLDEARKIVEAISLRLDEKANLIWGAQIREDMKGFIRVLLIANGVKGYLRIKNKIMEKKEKEILEEIGIKFIK
uniref:Cell division protein FtsZ n=1 Tax=Thermodesulfobacterium geofontis TaxID=1295609 RepID=A0A7V4N5E5_9BACT